MQTHVTYKKNRIICSGDVATRKCFNPEIINMLQLTFCNSYNNMTKGSFCWSLTWFDFIGLSLSNSFWIICPLISTNRKCMCFPYTIMKSDASRTKIISRPTLQLHGFNTYYVRKWRFDWIE